MSGQRLVVEVVGVLCRWNYIFMSISSSLCWLLACLWETHKLELDRVIQFCFRAESMVGSKEAGLDLGGIHGRSSLQVEPPTCKMCDFVPSS